ncbi:MAG: hypothetical protein R2719_13385 [Micropruina sp.]
MLLRHRGQDSTGIATAESNGIFHLHQAKGQVGKFRTHATCVRWSSTQVVRYATRVGLQRGGATVLRQRSLRHRLVHNGSLTSTRELTSELFPKDRRHLNTSSDAELLVNVLANELQNSMNGMDLSPEQVFQAVTRVTSGSGVVCRDRPHRRLQAAGLP